MTKTFSFLHTADWHVGVGRTSWGEDVSLERSAAMIDVIYECAAAARVDAVVMAGDVFEYKHVTESERTLVADKLSKYASRKYSIQTFGIPGNHDQQSESEASTDWLAAMSASGEVKNLHFARADRSLCVDVCKGLRLVLAPASLSERRRWVEEYVDALAGNSYVFVGHGLINGSVVDSGRALDSKLSLANAGKNDAVVYWAYGDIHKRQKLPTLPTGANGMYAGSPVQLNFGESAKRGGYIVTLVKESGWKLADKPKFVRMDLDARVRPLVTVTDAEQNVPDNALIRLATNVVLSKKQRRAIVKRVVVDDGIDTKKVSERIVNALPFDPIADDVRNILVAMRKEFDNVYAAKTTRKDKEAFMSARRGLRALVHNSIDSYRSSAITEGVGR